MRGSGAQRRIAHCRQPGLADALASAHNDREVPDAPIDSFAEDVRKRRLACGASSRARADGANSLGAQPPASPEGKRHLE